MSTSATSGRVVADAREQRVGVADLVDDLEPVSVSRRATPSRMSAASSAITTRMGSRCAMRRAAAGLALDDELRVQCLQPVAQARQARIGAGAAPPTPSSVDATRSVARVALQAHRGLATPMRA